MFLLDWYNSLLTGGPNSSFCLPSSSIYTVIIIYSTPGSQSDLLKFVIFDSTLLKILQCLLISPRGKITKITKWSKALRALSLTSSLSVPASLVYLLFHALVMLHKHGLASKCSLLLIYTQNKFPRINLMDHCFSFFFSMPKCHLISNAFRDHHIKDGNSSP